MKLTLIEQKELANRKKNIVPKGITDLKKFKKGLESPGTIQFSLDIPIVHHKIKVL